MVLGQVKHGSVKACEETGMSLHLLRGELNEPCTVIISKGKGGGWGGPGPHRQKEGRKK